MKTEKVVSANFVLVCCSFKPMPVMPFTTCPGCDAEEEDKKSEWQSTLTHVK
jgi:hypothetical protein